MSGAIGRVQRSGRPLRGRVQRPRGPSLRATLRELLMVTALLALLWFGGRQTIHAVHDAFTPDPVPMPVPAPHSRTVKLPMLIDLAVDESSSMLTSDPHDRRWADLSSLGAWLEKYEQPGDRVAVTRFTSDAQHGPISTVSALEVDPQGLAPDPIGGDTAFMPVVDAADQIFRQPQRAYFRILILVTDGQSSDADRAIDRLPLVANRVFVVALDRGSAWSGARDAWEQAGFPVTTVGNRSPNEIGAALATDVMRAAGQRPR